MAKVGVGERSWYDCHMAGLIRHRVGLLGGITVRVLAIVLGIVLGAGASGVGTPAAAQGFGWFGHLFGGGQPHPAAQPRFPGYDQQSDDYYARPRRTPRRHAAEPPRPPREHEAGTRDKDHPSPKSASFFVTVIGDSFGQNLASGLDEALADRQDVAVAHKAKGSTGLVATEFFDWPKAVDAMLAVETGKGKSASETVRHDEGKDGPTKPVAPATDVTNETKAEPSPSSTPVDVAVMMIGSNDRQAIHLEGAVLKPGTPEWLAQYQKRVLAIDEAFKRKGIPLIWVGVPIVRDDGFADDMAAFNDIYRQAAVKTGAVYVDTWEAFSDDDGDFSAVGPDIDGQMTRLRTADGIYFTKAGSRKLAHFVEVPVRRALEGKMARIPLFEKPTPGTGIVQKPDVGPISSLTDPPLSRGGQLAAAIPSRAPGVHDPQVETAIVNGNPQAAPVGRADDLKWPASGMPNP